MISARYATLAGGVTVVVAMALATGTASAQPSDSSDAGSSSSDADTSTAGSGSSTEAGSGQDPADNPKTSATTPGTSNTSSPPVKVGDAPTGSVGSGQEPSDGQIPNNVTITDVLNGMIQINQGVTALSQQEADRLAESTARLNAEASRRSGIPVMTVDDQPPPSAGSGQEPSDNGPASLNPKLGSSGETLDAYEGLEADAAKP
jgi:hypothetical protein